MEIYIIRHGETELNVKKVTQGIGDSPLTELGKEQAKKVANKLKDVQLDYIIASDLGRTMSTAEIVKKVYGKNIPLIPTKDLRELNFGIYNTTARETIKNECPGDPNDITYVYPNGESKAQMYKRVQGLVQKLFNEKKEETVLLVTHMGPIRAILSYVHNITYQETKEYNITNECMFHLKLNDKNEPQIEQVS